MSEWEEGEGGVWEGGGRGGCLGGRRGESAQVALVVLNGLLDA